MTDDEKKFLKNLYRESKIQFEKEYFKTLLNLSTGALVLSISVAQITYDSEVIYGSLLLSSWGFFGITILFVLIYFILSQYEVEKRIEDIDLNDDVNLQTEKELDQLAEYTNVKLKGKTLQAKWILSEESIIRKSYNNLGLLSSLAFLIGVFTLCVFTYYNLLW